MVRTFDHPEAGGRTVEEAGQHGYAVFFDLDGGERLEVRIEATGETTRRATVTGIGPRYEAIVRSLGEPAA